MKKIPIILALVICIILISLKFKNREPTVCPDPVRFDSKNWKENESSRFCMIEDIVESKILLNKSKKELKEILGEPFKEGAYYEGESLQYKTEEKANRYLNWYLHVELQNDTVVYLQKSAD